MIKKLLLLLTLTAAAVFAAIPGEVPGAAAHKLNWIDCSPMFLGKADPEVHKDIPEMRAIVFLMTRAGDTPQVIAMLENLRRQYQGRVLISLITPDNVSDAEALRKRFPDMRLRLAVDMERKLTPEYMKDTIMLFPMAFIMDRNGMIRWRGEAVDLPEAVKKMAQNKLPLEIQKKITPMVYTMQQHMRDGNMYKAQSHALQILAVDPGNPQALRMAVFASESRNRPAEAWHIVAAELKKSPDSPRLYFTALDLVMRHGECRRYLKQLIAEFAGHPVPPAVRCAFANTLLNSFPFEADAVLGAKNILAGTPMPINALPEQLAMLLAVRARLNYALGDLKAAEADMSEALQYLSVSGSRSQIAQAEKQLNYYRALLKHLEQEKR